MMGEEDAVCRPRRTIFLLIGLMVLLVQRRGANLPQESEANTS